jgi:putative membrane protein
MHPATPVLRTWKLLTVILVLVAYRVQDTPRIGSMIRDNPGLALAALVVLIVLGLLATVLSWRMTRFAVVDDQVHLRTGVVLRQQRNVNLDRLQAVEMVRPLLARIIGLVELRLEVAGGTGSAISLAYLSDVKAEQLRADLMARAAGLRHEEDDDEPFETAPERQVYEVPLGRLIGSILLSGSVIGSVAATLLPVVFVIMSGELTGLLALALPVLTAVGAVWKQVDQGIFFRAATSPDGIRLRHGLTESRAQTVPPGRVQAIRVRQGPLWRAMGWWKVQLNVAGLETSSNGPLHPVATRDEVHAALWLVVGRLDDVLDAAMVGKAGDGDGFVCAPRRARWLDPWGWRRIGYAATDQVLVLRSGRWWRQVIVVPHERTQALEVVQGPVQRTVRVASVTLHSMGGPVRPTVAHLDEDVVAQLLVEQAARARQARAAAVPEKWMLAQEDE